MIRQLGTGLLLLASTFNPSYAQQQHSFGVKFSYASLNRGKVDTSLFTLYYVIDSSSKLIFNKEVFYAFNFSTIRNGRDGYVLLDEKSKTLFFLSKYYKSKNKCSGSNKPQALFSFSKKTVGNLCYVGIIGSPSSIENITRKDSNDYLFVFRFMYNLSPPSDITYITGIEFDACFFPHAIILYDPFLNTEVRVAGERI